MTKSQDTTPARAEAQPYGLYAACQAVLDDYQTSDAHHPDHVLIRRTDFERIKALVEAPVVVQGAWNLVRQAHEILRSGNPPFSAREVNARGKLRDALNPDRARAEAQDEGAAGERDKRAWIDRWNAIEGAAQDALHTMSELLEAPNLKRMQYALGERRDALATALNLPEAGTAWMRPGHPSPTPAADADRVREATGAKAVVRDEQIVISIDVDALPGILSGSIATNAVAGLFKVTDPAEFANEVCGALNAEKEDGTTRVHKMFDSAFNHAIDQGAEGVEEVSEDEFEAEAQRIQSEALAALKSEGK